MFREFFSKEIKAENGRECITVGNLGDYSLTDTLLCGQCFRYEEIEKNDGYAEYFTVIGDKIVFVGQKKKGELMFYGITEDELDRTARQYFDLDTDYGKINQALIGTIDNEFFRLAAASASGIAILRQDPWETICSFIISQNNNIPRIRRIIREISSAYGVNLALQNGLKSCPISKNCEKPSEEKCALCGRCYSFPEPADILKNPELLLPSKPGFRYKYILDAAKKIESGEVDIKKIKEANSYEVTVAELSKILGVGLKVASCAALFGFYNLEAFPIDVWMRRAIDEHFGGDLDSKVFGKYAGIAQQYIFHYIRNIKSEE
ncbi:MAG: DNA-3-methyladenine glycosylase 2 family protein [Clostridia bacterium]|nr:DNA-3-methyladenine glycosylase 2 family protein [Clostridia bacterium]